MLWINRLNQQRSAQPPSAAPSPTTSRPEPQGPTALAGLGVSDKVIAAHGESFLPSLPELRGIAEGTRGLEAHLATKLGYALDRFYQDLGRALGRAPAAEREDITRTALGALRSVVERQASSETLIAATTVLSSLLFSRPRADDEPFGRLATAATRELSLLLDAVDGRRGAGTFLFGYRNMVETAEARGKADRLAGRTLLWEKVRSYLADCSPKRGMDQATLADLAERFATALDGKAGPARALEETRAAVLSAGKAGLDAVRAELRATVDPLEHPKPPRGLALTAKALESLVAAAPLGPESLWTSAKALQKVAAELFSTKDDAELTGLARVIAAIERSSMVEPALALLTDVLPKLTDKPELRGVLAAVEGPGDVPRLLLTFAGVRPEVLDTSGLERSSLTDGLRAACTGRYFVGHQHAAEILALIVEAAPRFDEVSGLHTFADRASSVFSWMGNRLDPEAARVVARTLASRPTLPGYTQVTGAAELVQKATEACPGLDILALAKPGKSGPSLLDLSTHNTLGRDETKFFLELLTSIASSRLPKDEQLGLARRAIEVAIGVGRLDRDPSGIFPRIREDWSVVLTKPSRLRTADRYGSSVAIRTSAKPTALTFFERHPELPAEVAFTLGRVLSRAQLSWIVGEMSATRNQQRVRVLRDAALAAIEAGHLSFLDAARETKLPAKVVSEALQYVALEYRQGRGATIPFGRLSAGLNSGRDVLAEVKAEQSKAALALIGIAEGAGVFQADGLATIRKNQPEVEALLAFMRDGEDLFGVPSRHFRDPIVGCLRSIADGTWPNVKYADEIAERQLDGLTAEQRAIWAQEMVTTAPHGAWVDRPEIMESLPVLRGLVAALPLEARLEHPDLPPLGWDSASRDLLAGLRDDLLASLRGVQKGSPEHARASARLGPVSDRLAALDLFLHLADLAPRLDVDPGSMLVALQGELGPGAAAARKLGARGSAEALRQLNELAGTLDTSPRAGLHAVDQDALEAYMTSFGGGCLHPVTGFNRAGLAELMASAQYKMGRIMRGDTCVGRTIFRLVRIEHEGYSGHALRMDEPLDPKNWRNSNAGEELDVMVEHGLAKARAMGIPFIFHVRAGKAAAEKVGLEVLENADLKIHLDRGHTGLHHSQGFNIGRYFVAWPGLNSGYIDARGDENATSVQLVGRMSIVYPNQPVPAQDAAQGA